MPTWPFIIDITIGIAALLYANLPHMHEPKNATSRLILRVAGYAILILGLTRLGAWALA